MELIRRALILEYATAAWCVFEAAAGIVLGARAGSVSLMGFGLDSLIEVAAAVALIWRLQVKGSPDEESAREKAALKIVGLTFFALAAYIAFESARTLWMREKPEASVLGIALAAVAAAVMPALGLAKRKVARAMGSRALAADGMESLLCAYLSVTVLIGLGLNAIWGFWWADPVAGLVLVGFVIKEGREAFEGEGCCSCGD